MLAWWNTPLGKDAEYIPSVDSVQPLHKPASAGLGCRARCQRRHQKRFCFALPVEGALSPMQNSSAHRAHVEGFAAQRLRPSFRLVHGRGRGHVLGHEKRMPARWGSERSCLRSLRFKTAAAPVRVHFVHHPVPSKRRCSLHSCAGSRPPQTRASLARSIPAFHV